MKDRRQSSIEKSVLIMAVLQMLPACTLQANITDLQTVATPSVGSLKAAPLLVHGQTVSMGSGYVIRGSFGEISERQQLPASEFAIDGVSNE
ncbi:hypothetical protein ACLWBD_05305 [Bdellovibrio sp. HCB117]|nr:hypothetical protein [Bdellovibrio bacteriovorus]